MDLAAELADRDMSVNICIEGESVHIILFNCVDGTWASKSRVPMSADIWQNIAAEIERLLEGCDGRAD